MSWKTRDERLKMGQAARKLVPRQDHSEISKKRRPVSALDLLKQSMKGRLPELVKLKYERMVASPFGYFRGATWVMAADLNQLPNTGLTAQLCGDAHVRNLGAFAAPDGRLIFDINDYDETMPGPFEWDLKRMAASIVLAGQEAKQKNGNAVKAAQLCVESYVSLMLELAEMTLLETARWQVHMNQVSPIHAALLKAERSTPAHNLELLTVPTSAKKGAPRIFKEVKPLLTRVTGKDADAVIAALEPYAARLEPQRRHLLTMYRPVDVAFKVVGTGSVGLRDYCIYFEGNDLNDPLFLQVKEEPDSCFAPYLKGAQVKHNGQRVVEGQRAMQIQTDPFLGWTDLAGGNYLVRQLNDHKGSIEITDLAGGGLAAYAQVCGQLLARSHARSSDPVVLAGYLGEGVKFAEAIGDFGKAYAEVTVKDWEDLKEAGVA